MPRRHAELTLEQIEKARGFIRLGVSWNALPSLVGASYWSIRTHFDRRYRDARQEIVQRARERQRGMPVERRAPGPKSGNLPKLTHTPHQFSGPMDRPNVPDKVWEERERAFGAEYSELSALMGDPRPGRSALDKRRPHIVVAN